MAIPRNTATSVGTSATAIPGTEYPQFLLQNLGPGDLFIGGSTVATTDGYRVAEGASYSPSEKAHESLRGLVGDRLYGIAASGTRDVRVLLQGKDPNA